MPHHCPFIRVINEIGKLIAIQICNGLKKLDMADDGCCPNDKQQPLGISSESTVVKLLV